jgi:hypothetical protein
MQKIASNAGFARVEQVIAGKSTSRPDVIDAEILEQESWSDPSQPHTVMIEAFKDY